MRLLEAMPSAVVVRIRNIKRNDSLQAIFYWKILCRKINFAEKGGFL